MRFWIIYFLVKIPFFGLFYGVLARVVLSFFLAGQPWWPTFLVTQSLSIKKASYGPIKDIREGSEYASVFKISHDNDYYPLFVFLVEFNYVNIKSVHTIYNFFWFTSIYNYTHSIYIKPLSANPTKWSHSNNSSALWRLTVWVTLTILWYRRLKG